MATKRAPESPIDSEPAFKKVCRTLSPSFQPDTTEAEQAEPLFQDEAFAPDTSVASAPLTRRNLRLLEKMTKSGKQSVASAPASVTASSDASKSKASSKTKSHISTTENGFESQLRKNGVLSPWECEDCPPSNEAEIMAFITNSRRSASPTRDRHKVYTGKIQRNSSERELERHIESHIFQATGDNDELSKILYVPKYDKQWMDFPRDVGFNNGLSPPKPDLIEGFWQTEFPDTIYQLGGTATLVKAGGYIAFPHFAAEFKDQGKDMHQAEVQACFDGAAMVYARDSALKFLGERDPPRHASVVTVKTDGDVWEAYAHYSHRNPKTGVLEYFQYTLKSGSLKKFDDNKEGRRILRNIQDWARLQATDLKDRFHKYDNRTAARSARSNTRPSVSGSNTSVPVPKSVSPQQGRSAASSSSNTSDKDRRTQLDRQAMPPPPSRSSDTSSVRSGDSRPSPAKSTTSVLLPLKKPTATQSTSSSRSGDSRAHTPVSVSSAASDRHSPSQKQPVIADRDRDRDRQGRDVRAGEPGPSHRRPGSDTASEQDRRSRTVSNQYRDRNAPTLQTRRSDSPERNRPARPQDVEADRRRRDEKQRQGSSISSDPAYARRW